MKSEQKFCIGIRNKQSVVKQKVVIVICTLIFHGNRDPKITPVEREQEATKTATGCFIKIGYSKHIELFELVQLVCTFSYS